MSEFRTQRVRDPIHGLIVFRKGDRRDELAWRLIDTPEFQRLRRVKQLGVSEFVFPSATHTRFAHCVGVFHTARKLAEIIRREIGSIGETFNEDRADVAVIAALLHDLGHGPFSHTFEEVMRAQGVKKRHEIWTAEIIENKAGQLYPILESFRSKPGFCKEVADLLSSEDPTDIYHAIVSSSFDADRLDYLRRDRAMTGTGAGAIDFDWLVEHVRVKIVNLDADDYEPEDENSTSKAPTFCIDGKALPAAEQFLLSRYALHEQVYFHKTTRCIEHMIAALLKMVANECKNKKTASSQTGLDKDHPLLLFFYKDGMNLQNYLNLDDTVVMGAIERMCLGHSAAISELSKRIRNRLLYKTLDVSRFGLDEGRQRGGARRIDQRLAKGEFKKAVIKDEGASLSIYSQVGGDDEKAHKKLRILDAKGHAWEISARSKIIEQLALKRPLTRYYFESESDRELAVNGSGDTQHGS